MKNKLIIISVIIFLGLGFSAQSQKITNLNPLDTANYPYWINMMQDPSVNFFKVQSAFNKYWENRPITRGCGWKPFKRWEYMMQSRVSPTGERPAESRTLNAFMDYYKNPANAPRSQNGNWTNLGPFNLPLGDRGYKGLGRVNAIGFHPTDPNIIYVGAPSGGLWVSTNGGSTWSSNTDNLPTLGVSAVVVDHSNPQNIYIGTGDRDAGDASGLGVMKSTDGGLSWALSNNGMGETTVGRLIMHPNNANLLLAAANNGIYKTTDGGLNWTKTYSGTFKDVIFKTNDPSIVYATSAGKFYRSSDTGDTWTEITTGLTIGSRGAIGVTPANPNVVYFLLTNSANEFQGLYKSTDNGLTFTENSNSPNIMDWSCDGSGTGGQAWYDLDIAVDPTNENIIYSGGVDIWKSTDGGRNWAINAHWWGDCSRPAVHADHHIFEISPLNNKLYVGCDGGIYWTNNGGTNWNEISSGLAISQTYKLGQSATVDNLVINGYQDNGSSIYEGTSWTAVNGGDGMECAIDPTDSHYRYSTLYYGDISRHYNNNNQGKIAGNNTNGIDESGAWVTPFLIDENDSKTMFIGYKNVWRSNNIKNPNVNGVIWTKISNGLTGDNLSVLEQSPKNTNILYVAGGNKLYRTDNCKDNNPVWINLTSKLPSNKTITDLEAHPFDENVIYMTLENRVYKSSDKGNNWTDITSLLPDVHISTIVYNKHSQNGIYIGTDMGVFYRDASFCGWTSFSNGLPANGRVTELEIYYDDANPANDRIKAATYGRGLWESDLYFSTPMANFTSDQTNIPIGCSVNFTDLSNGVPFSWQWSFPGGTPATSHQRNPAGITYNTPGKYDVQLIVTNDAGADTLIMPQFIQVSDALYPEANFVADNKSFCSTEQPIVKFTDATSFCPNSWNWIFNPSTISFVNGTNASSKNPEVKFNAEGNYSVTLISSNSNGSDTVTKLNYINVGGIPLPFTEDFELGYNDKNWNIVNADNAITWDIATVSGTSPGSKAAMMNFYNYLVPRKRDQLISPVLDFSGTDAVTLTFQHAYAKRYTTSNDSLTVSVSGDCGTSWTPVYQVSGNGNGNLVTHALMTDEFFPLSSDDWCGGSFGNNCNTLDLSPWAGNKNIRIKFETYNFFGNNLFIDNINITPGSVTGHTVNGIVTYPKTTPVPLNNINVDLKTSSGNIVASSVTATDGSYTFTNIADGDYLLAPSSAKPWSGVSAADVLLYKKHIAGITPLTGIFLASGDVNGSGGLTASDVLLIKKRIAGVITSFTTGDWLYNCSPLTVNGANITQNFNGLIYGDANASYTPVEDNNNPAEVPEFKNTSSETLTIQSLASSTGQLTVPVYATNVSSLGAFQFTISYDASKLQFTGADNWLTGINEVTVGNPKPGQITFVWAADADGISISNNKLFDLHFLSSIPDKSSISWSNDPTPIEFSDWDGNIFEPNFTDGKMDIITGIAEQKTNSLAIFPNPNHGTFSIEIYSPIPEKVNILVFNMMGKNVFEDKNIPIKDSFSGTINLGNLPDGLYMVQIQSVNGSCSKTIMIQR